MRSPSSPNPKRHVTSEDVLTWIATAVLIGGIAATISAAVAGG